MDLPPFLEGFLGQLPAGFAIKDAGLRYVYANRFLRETADAGAWIGERSPGSLPEGELPAHLEAGARALAGDRTESELALALPSGARRLFRVSEFPLRLQDGASYVGCILCDVTSLKDAQRELASAVESKDFLLKELHHRVKNNLATVSSLLSLESQGIDDARALKAFDECQSRIDSMALVHEELYGSEDLSRLDFGPYLAKIAERLVRCSGIALRVRLQLETESVLMDPAVAMPLGLVANELLTNSLKYAFPCGRSGSIAVSLRRRPPSAVLSVADDGIGLPQGLDPESSPSLGLLLVRSLSRQAGGAAEFRGGAGFECRVTVPV
jgi:two-component sensor histidine kinase